MDPVHEGPYFDGPGPETLTTMGVYGPESMFCTFPPAWVSKGMFFKRPL